MSGRLFGYLKEAVHREPCSMLCGSLDGKGVWVGVDTCIRVAEPLSGCPSEHIATFLTGYVLSHFSHVLLFATPWTVAHQALLSMGFSRQEYWSGLACPPSVLLQYKIKSLKNERCCRYTCIGIKRWLQHGNRHKEGKGYKAGYTQKSACLRVGLALPFHCCGTRAEFIELPRAPVPPSGNWGGYLTSCWRTEGDSPLKGHCAWHTLSAQKIILLS